MKVSTDGIIKNLVSNYFDKQTADQFVERASKGLLTRDEDSKTHFCVYFAAYDPDTKEAFVGHHKKSGLWLFNGGHIDKGEISAEALEREIGEEWGLGISANTVGTPQLFTVTGINNPTKQTCTRHYDIWYFVKLDKNNTVFDNAKLEKEFYETSWLSPEKAKPLVKDPNTLKALDFLENKFK